MSDRPVYTDIMIDIETTGLEPNRNAILQIGAVKFNKDTQEVSPDFFNMSLSMMPWRSWDQGTLSWWRNQKPGLLESIMLQQKPYKEVMEAFQVYVNEANKDLLGRTHQQGIRFWSKPTHFDFMFIAGYFSDCGLVNPLSYRDANDMNSYIRGLYYPEQVDMDLERSVLHNGDAHDGLQDCFYQLKILFAHLNKVGK